MIVKTLESAPKDATHWSTRSMAAESGLTQSTVSRIWRAFGLQPHRQDSWKLSKAPQFVDKVKGRRRTLPRPTRTGRGAVCGREVPDPGGGPDRADPADAARHAAARHPRLHPSRHLQLVCRTRHHHRQGHRTAARPTPGDRVQEVPDHHRQGGSRRPDGAPGHGQRRDPQDPGDPTLATRPSALRRALHPDLEFVVSRVKQVAEIRARESWGRPGARRRCGRRRAGSRTGTRGAGSCCTRSGRPRRGPAVRCRR